MTDMDMEKLKINSKKFYEGYNRGAAKNQKRSEKAGSGEAQTRAQSGKETFSEQLKG